MAPLLLKVYVLDQKLSLESAATKARLLQAMEGYRLGQEHLMGKYRP
jgi:phosphatidylethanolamine-binding protein (PEBP) family uncharacterized protein